MRALQYGPSDAWKELEPIADHMQVSGGLCAVLIGIAVGTTVFCRQLPRKNASNESSNFPCRSKVWEQELRF